MIACAIIPHFAITIERQMDQTFSAAPLILSQSSPSGERVFALSPDLRQSGLKPEMPLGQARALAPQARIIPANRASYQEVLNKLAFVLNTFSPVEVAMEHHRLVCYLDLGPLTAGNLVELVQLLGQTVREKSGLAPALGLDSGKFPAQMAALSTSPNKARLIQSGQEADFLAPLSVNYLPIRPDLKQHLHLLGLHTIGRVATLPARALFNQFGYEGRRLQRLAHGYDDRPVLPYQPKRTVRVDHQVDEPVASGLILDALLGTIAAQLETKLRKKGQAGRDLALGLLLEDETKIVQQLVLRFATNDARLLTQSLKSLLNRSRIHCGVVELSISLSDLSTATGRQLDLFVHQTQQRNRLQDWLPDLVARYGSTSFYQPLLATQITCLPEERFHLQEVKGE